LSESSSENPKKNLFLSNDIMSSFLLLLLNYDSRRKITQPETTVLFASYKLIRMAKGSLLDIDM
jgi:hypothetical protein